MTIGERLKQLRKELNLTQEAFAARIGSVQNTVTGYESGRRNPSAPVISLICREFNVNEEWLRFGTGPMYAPKATDELEAMAKKYSLSDADQALIEKYVNLNSDSREIILDFITDVAAAVAGDEDPFANIPDTPELPKTKVIPLYLTPAAAGYASPALGSDYEEYSVPIESKADFACKIQGDSMEPVIKDGDIVLVKRQIDLEPGDVGLFYVDGDMKCKQYCEDCYGNIYLFSLNRERSDADVTVWASSGISVFCFGKVILDKRPPLPRD